MNNKEYVTLFKERKWKLALDAMPLNLPRAIMLDKPGDFLILRARASEFSKDGPKKASVTFDFDAEPNVAIVTVTKK